MVRQDARVQHVGVRDDDARVATDGRALVVGRVAVVGGDQAIEVGRWTLADSNA